MMGSWIGCHGRGIGLFGDVGRGYDGRCLRVWPWDCVWGAQGHNEQMAAGGSPGSGRGKKRPTPPALLGTEPESRGVLSRRYAHAPPAPRWASLCPQVASLRTAPIGALPLPLRRGQMDAAAPTELTALGLSAIWLYSPKAPRCGPGPSPGWSGLVAGLPSTPRSG